MNPRTLKTTLYRLVALLLVLSALPLVAQTKAARHVPDRYLIILDTSSAMKRRAPAVVQSVESLLRSNMSEQLNPGDTIGIWTFDEQLYTGRFPLLVWNNERIAANSSNVLGFIKAQKYQKKSKIEAVMPAFKRIVQDSPRLTVFLISDGSEKITGTPYDHKIELAFQENYKEQDRLRMPFITVFRTMRGKYMNGGVNLAPWPVELRELPPEPVIATAPKTNVPPAATQAAEVKPATRKTLPPLVLVGKKDTNTPVAAFVPATASPATVAASPSPAPKPVITPTPPQLDPNDPNLITITAKGAEPTHLAPAPATTPVPAPTTAPVVASNPTTATGLVAPATPTPSPEVAPVAKPQESPKASVTNPPAVASTPPPTTLAETKPAKAENLDVVFSFAFSRAGILVIAGVGTLLLGVGALFFIGQQRRARATPVSLITSSMDRHNK